MSEKEQGMARKPDRPGSLCSDCPPVGYPVDKTRCLPCPLRNFEAFAALATQEKGDG